MDREELIRILDQSFQLADWQEEEKGGKGYRLCLRASWNLSSLDIRSFQVQLVGTNPLTGEDVKFENITATFSFDQKTYQSRKLTYHGKFWLRCVAVLQSGEQVEFRKQEVGLEYASNRPEICYSVKEIQGFRLIEMRSNCWGNCRGKVWITIDGHDQRVDIPAGSDKTVRFYMSALGKVSRVRVQDNDVIIRQER